MGNKKEIENYVFCGGGVEKKKKNVEMNGRVSVRLFAIFLNSIFENYVFFDMQLRELACSESLRLNKKEIENPVNVKNKKKQFIKSLF